MKKRLMIILIFMLIILGILFIFKPNSNTSEIPIPEGMAYVKGNEKSKAYLIDKTLVTVAQFRKFVEATQYKTEAEKFGDAGTFDFKTGEWSLIKGAYWQYPESRTKSKAPDNHPVTQVSWNDAVAYYQWAKNAYPQKQNTILLQITPKKNSKRMLGEKMQSKMESIKPISGKAHSHNIIQMKMGS